MTGLLRIPGRKGYYPYPLGIEISILRILLTYDNLCVAHRDVLPLPEPFLTGTEKMQRRGDSLTGHTKCIGIEVKSVRVQSAGESGCNQITREVR